MGINTVLGRLAGQMCIVAAVTVGWASHAVAAEDHGLVLTARQLPAGTADHLRALVDASRKQYPGTFQALGQVKGCTRVGYQNNRNPKPVCYHEFHGLGVEGVPAMLDALLLHDPTALYSTDVEKRAVIAGLLRAVGVARDVRAGDLLQLIFATPGVVDVAQAEAAQALGRLARDTDVSLLIAHSSPSDPLHAAAVEGLGECKQVRAAEQLAKLTTQVSTSAQRAWVARSLGHVASSWGWQALVRSGKATEAQGRQVSEIAAKALVPMYAQADPAVRTAVLQALRMAEYAQSAQLIESARAGKDAATVAAYADLAQKVAYSMR